MVRERRDLVRLGAAIWRHLMLQQNINMSSLSAPSPSRTRRQCNSIPFCPQNGQIHSLPFPDFTYGLASLPLGGCLAKACPAVVVCHGKLEETKMYLTLSHYVAALWKGQNLRLWWVLRASWLVVQKWDNWGWKGFCLAAGTWGTE